MPSTADASAKPIVTRPLLEDGSLAVSADAEVWPAVEHWVPRFPPGAPAPDQPRACIRVRRGPPGFAAPTEKPAMDLRGVEGWIRPPRILLREPRGRVGGIVDLAAKRAELRLDGPLEVDGALAVETVAALTLAAAFLVGRLDRSLVHAGAVVAPGGGAWLLSGGTFSGKTTTCVNLIRAGWSWLSDDHVVLSRAPGGGITVEGWPRRFSLDNGFAEGRSLGARTRVDPAAFGPGTWCRSAPLAGAFFPRVEAAEPTATEPMHPAGALGRLLQGSPWLLADSEAAPSILALQRDAASLPVHDLRLGADCYQDPARLAAILASVAAPQVTRGTPGDGTAARTA
jgi:hypothetical protein